MVKRILPKWLYNKFFLQSLLALFMVGMAAFFISHENLEIVKIREQLSECDPLYISIGIGLTICYVLLMGLMYIETFRSVGKKVSLKSTIKLYLKRNVVSVFLPAGGFSSLIFFTNEVEKEGATKTQIHLASSLYGFVSMASVIVVAIPILGYAVVRNSVQQSAIWGFIGLLVLTSAFAVLLSSIFKRTWAYDLLRRIKPELAVSLDEVLGQNIRLKNVLLALFFSVLVEIIGVLHLYVSMLALGCEPSIMASMFGYITMVLLLMASPFLRGLGAIEVSVTYILGQYGYPLVIATSITLLYRFFEFWLPLAVGLISFISKKDNVILRILPGIMIFVLGLVNIISAMTPAVPERMLILMEWIPEGIPRMSNGMILIIGLFMLILCVFLLQGSRRAWYVATVLSLLSMAGHLLKGVDYEESILALCTAVILWRTRDFYRFRPHKKLTRISLRVLVFSVLTLLTFGVMAFLLMDKKHFGVDFNLWESVKSMLRLFFLFDDEGLVPRTAFAQNFIYAIYTAGGLVFCFIFFSILKPFFSKPYNTEEEREHAALLLQKYGRSAFDYFKISPDKLFFFSDKSDGFISFKVYRYYAIAIGNPVCIDEETARKLIVSFEKYCLENGLISIYYRVPKESLALYTYLGKRSVPIGDEAVLNLETFSLGGIKMKSARKNINYLKNQGFATKIYPAPVDNELLEKLKDVSENWLHGLHDKEVDFSESLFDSAFMKKQTIITVEDQSGRIYAFLNLIPYNVSGEATYDLIRKVSDAPNGILDMLLVRAILFLKEQGFQSVNLGMAPFSGLKGTSFVERVTNFAYEHLKSFGHFKGIRTYKEKFSSHWEQKYLVYSNNYYLPRILKVMKHLSKDM